MAYVSALKLTPSEGLVDSLPLEGGGEIRFRRLELLPPRRKKECCFQIVMHDLHSRLPERNEYPDSAWRSDNGRRPVAIFSPIAGRRAAASVAVAAPVAAMVPGAMPAPLAFPPSPAARRIGGGNGWHQHPRTQNHAHRKNGDQTWFHAILPPSLCAFMQRDAAAPAKGLAGAAAPPYRIGGAYISPPSVHSAFRPRGRLIAVLGPKCRSYISP